MDRKINEYGSQFEYSPIRDINKGGFYEEDGIYLRSGRECLLWVGLTCLERKISRVLMPALCCPAMVQPFKQLGFDVVFYQISSNLTIDTEDLLARMSNDTLILVIHYYGIRGYSKEDIMSIKRSFDNVLFVQDNTQCLFTCSLHDDDVTDFSIASIRKWLAIPDGAVLRTNTELANIVKSGDSVFAKRWYQAMKLKTLFLENGDQDIKRQYRAIFAECASGLRKEEVVITKISSISSSLLSTIDVDEVKKRRKTNFDALYEWIKNEEPEVVKYCKEQDAPLCLPLLVENRDELQKILSNINIYCQVLWPSPEGTEKYEFSRWFSSHMLAIPCDQRYDVDGMKYVAQSIVESLNSAAL